MPLLKAIPCAMTVPLGKHGHLFQRQCGGNISTYDADGAQYGAHQLAPHLSRISKDGANFLKFLGYTEDVATNFEDAYRLSDIGKIDKRYDPQIWSLPHRPTEEERALKRKHTDWALDVIATYIRDDETLLLGHPHVQKYYSCARAISS